MPRQKITMSHIQDNKCISGDSLLPEFEVPHIRLWRQHLGPPEVSLLPGPLITLSTYLAVRWSACLRQVNGHEPIAASERASEAAAFACQPPTQRNPAIQPRSQAGAKFIHLKKNSLKLSAAAAAAAASLLFILTGRRVRVRPHSEPR